MCLLLATVAAKLVLRMVGALGAVGGVLFGLRGGNAEGSEGSNAEELVIAEELGLGLPALGLSVGPSSSGFIVIGGGCLARGA